MLDAGRNTIEIANQSALMTIPVAAQTIIYEGSLVAINAGGYAIPANKAEDIIAVGRAEEYVDNHAGSNGTTTILVKRGAFVWDNDSTNAVTVADLMQDCYILDDCTVTSLATGSSRAGKVVGVFDYGVAVETV